MTRSDGAVSAGVEYRAGVTGLEVRAEEGERPKLVGYAAVFSEQSEDLGGFREQIAPGAFASSLGDDIRALVNHDSSRVIGRTRSGTLALEEDERGLRAEITPPDTSYGRDLVESVSRGDVSQMSFGFRVRPGGQRFEERDDGMILRTLTDVQLFEVSPVTFPAYPQTDIAVRSLESWIAEQVPAAEDGLLNIEPNEAHGRMRKIRDSVVAKEKRGRDWFEIREAISTSEAGDPVSEILIYDAIGIYGTEPRAFVEKLGELKGHRLLLRVNSPGGFVFDGAAIYNALRQHDGDVEVHIEGLAASMASVLAMAGTRVRMNQTAFMMIHNASGCVLGDARAMRHEADLLEKINRTLAQTYAIRTGKDVSEFLALMAEETWFTADEAKELGLVDEVMHGGPASLRHHDLSHFRNVPEAVFETRRAQVRQAYRERRMDLALRERTSAL